MLRTFVSGKIHQLKVTGVQPGYNGSCLICPDLLAAAGIEPFRRNGRGKCSTPWTGAKAVPLRKFSRR